MTVRLRYLFPPPMVVGRRTKLPSGNVYRIPILSRNRIIDVDDADVDTLLAYKGECCVGGRGKVPQFERVE